MAVTLDSLKKTVGKKKVKSMAFAWLADYENQAGDSTTALARVDAGLQLYPGDIPGMLVRTKLLFQLGDFEECVKECERILQKEPFCLSAQKRMGEAYEKLENIDERNRCYRRVHDMDPLDTFWKEEYEAVPEAAVDAAAIAGAVAAGEAAADSEFAMPDMGEFTMDTAAESAEPAVEASADATAGEEPAAKEENSLFSKSLDMDIESPATEAAEEPEQPKASASPFSASDDEDPFAALSSLGNDDSLADESSIDTLQQSLESALGDAATDITLDQDIPEAEEISGNDVGSAFADLFGEEDDMDSFGETTESKPASPFAQMDLPTSLDDEPAAPEDSAKNVFGEEAVEDKPQSIDDAFGDIFGEDELPEELPSNTAAPKAEPAEEQKPEEESFSGGMFEKSAAADMGLGTEDDLKLEEPEPEPAKEADKPQSLDSAFADIFGEDELPEELPPAQPAGESDVSADLELPADSSTGSLTEDADLELPAEDAPAADLELPSLDDSTSALTDELEMPSEDKPAEETPAESLDTFDIANWSPDAKPADDASLELPAEEETPAEEPTLELPAADEAPAEEVADLELPAEEPALDIPAEEPSLELPAEETPAEEAADLELPAEEPAVEPSLEMPAEEPAQEKPADESADVGFSVDKAFDALFADDDELPEEKPAETASAEPEVSDNVTETTEPVEDAAESDSDRAELDKEMDSAFSSLFAEDDDLPVEESKPEAAAAPESTQEDTGAALEEAPLADAALESDLDKSFSSLFGEDDALDEADLKPAEAPAADATAEPAAEELPEVSATQGNAGIESSLESEFSGAFKQLFNTDDDSLDEKTDLPSNKGVDFLMSGDSDDEVSAGLVADPTAPLDKQSSDLDDGMKTPTLGEIYFEQGHYDRALEIYKELAEKDPENEAIANRLAEVQKAYDSKFGGEQNG